MRVFMTLASLLFVASASAELAEGDVTRWLASMDDVKDWTAAHKDQISQESLMEKDLKSVDSIYSEALKKNWAIWVYTTALTA